MDAATTPVTTIPPKLDSQAFNDPAKEQDAIQQHAYALSAVMESLVILKMTWEQNGFPPSADFEKALKRVSNTALSVVPNQYKPAVFRVIEEASKDPAPDSLPETPPHVEQAVPTT